MAAGAPPSSSAPSNTTLESDADKYALQRGFPFLRIARTFARAAAKEK
jgi:hypothetical protein